MFVRIALSMWDSSQSLENNSCKLSPHKKNQNKFLRQCRQWNYIHKLLKFFHFLKLKFMEKSFTSWKRVLINLYPQHIQVRWSAGRNLGREIFSLSFVFNLIWSSYLHRELSVNGKHMHVGYQTRLRMKLYGQGS